MEHTGTTLMFAMLIGYFIPALVANCRHHHNGSAIFALNLLLGWTGLGWCAALIWSLTEVHTPVLTESVATVPFIHDAKPAEVPVEPIRTFPHRHL